MLFEKKHLETLSQMQNDVQDYRKETKVQWRSWILIRAVLIFQKYMKTQSLTQMKVFTKNIS